WILVIPLVSAAGTASAIRSAASVATAAKSAITSTAVAAATAIASAITAAAFFTSTATVLTVTGFQETNVIGNNFRHIDAFAFVVLVVAHLDTAFDRSKTPLAKIIGTRLSKLPPRNYRYEISFTFAPTTCKWPVDR